MDHAEEEDEFEMKIKEKPWQCIKITANGACEL